MRWRTGHDDASTGWSDDLATDYLARAFTRCSAEATKGLTASDKGARGAIALTWPPTVGGADLKNGQTQNAMATYGEVGSDNHVSEAHASGTAAPK